MRKQYRGWVCNNVETQGKIYLMFTYDSKYIYVGIIEVTLLNILSPLKKIKWLL